MASRIEQLWLAYVQAGKQAIDDELEFRSYTGRAQYKLWNYDYQLERFFIENLNTGRKNSSFGKGEFSNSMEKLLDADGVLVKGGLNSVDMHEFAIVHIHPQIDFDGEFIRLQYFSQ